MERGGEEGGGADVTSAKIKMNISKKQNLYFHLIMRLYIQFILAFIAFILQINLNFLACF